MDGRTLLAVALCAAALSQCAFAQQVTERRKNDFEFSIGFPYLQPETTTFDGGTVVNSDSSTGVGFDFDWHFADRWSAGATVAMHHINYTANIAVSGSLLGAPGDVVRSNVDTQSLMGHVNRYFGDFKRVTPYATAGLGWVLIDTNIPTGPPIGLCWFDPWFGYACSESQPTRTMTELGTQAGVGMRWDFSRRVFLDASVDREWIDFSHAHRPDFTQFRIAFGIHEG